MGRRNIRVAPRRAPSQTRRPRGNGIIAIRDCEMYVLSLEKFNYLADQHKRIALVLMTKLARLRHTNEELTLLQDN